MNLRYLYNHKNCTVTIRAEISGYLPADSAPHSWSSRRPRLGEINVVAEKTFKQGATKQIKAYVADLYATAAEIRAKAKYRRPIFILKRKGHGSGQ